MAGWPRVQLDRRRPERLPRDTAGEGARRMSALDACAACAELRAGSPPTERPSSSSSATKSVEYGLRIGSRKARGASACHFGSRSSSIVHVRAATPSHSTRANASVRLNVSRFGSPEASSTSTRSSPTSGGRVDAVAPLLPTMQLMPPLLMPPPLMMPPPLPLLLLPTQSPPPPLAHSAAATPGLRSANSVASSSALISGSCSAPGIAISS